MGVLVPVTVPQPAKAEMQNMTRISRIRTKVTDEDSAFDQARGIDGFVLLWLIFYE
jgi:hypothetical protein